ncbi:MAG: RNA degradosome polyphosphate kinase, partial [Alphaproteobacteria bacterium]|nr:RNA degradosome polyphosphate kinase [Alphaproteobacteria bacterium]
MSKVKPRIVAGGETPSDALIDDLPPAAEQALGEIFTTQESALAPAIDPASPARFINRELSWLAFNRRVLEEAKNVRHPVLERLRFLSISASNLDEFYMVRVAGLKGMVNAGVTTKSDDGLSPAEQLVGVNAAADELIADQQTVWAALHAELREAGIAIIAPEELTAADREWLDKQFRDQIFPVLTPLAIDPAHPFPFIPNLGFTLALKLVRRDGKNVRALLPVPPQLLRFWRLPTAEKRARFLPLESLIGLHLDKLFPGHTVVGSGLFRILRDSEVELEEEAEDLVRQFETLLRRRRRGEVMHMKCSKSMPADLREFIVDHLQLEPDEVVLIEHLLGVSDLGR